jgi:hypothetical protein
VRQVRVGAAELHRVAAFWAAATGGRAERAAVHGRMVDWALAAQAGVHPELLISSREPPGRVTLTVEVDDPEGNRALLVQRRPDPAGGRYRG